MAGKAHVDDSVIERRLRPIYDWLDNGNNKKAAQEADKVLRKLPSLQCARVLKGLAFLRLGKTEECSDLINVVVTEGTADDATLQALTICYREMHQPERICTLYEKAAKIDPNNEDIISHLFMAHVRVGDYKKQQLAALQLYKLKPKNPYYFWAVMSIVMQSHVTRDTASKKVSLQLAERMVLKFINEDKIESEAEVLTYLYILEIQGKFSEALEVLDGPLAEKIVQQPQNFLPMKKANYHTQLEQYEAASIIYMNLILHELDNWQHYVNFTDTVLSMHDGFVSNPEGKTDPLVEASKFLKETKKNALSDEFNLNRSPFIGPLQFALKLKAKGLDERIETLCGDITDQLYVYVKHFGDKMCCYGDIVNFLPLIPKDKQVSYLESIKDLVEFNEEGTPVDIKNIYRHQIYMQLTKALEQHASFTADEHLRFAESLVSFYQKTSPLSSHMVPTDIRPNDTYLILAAHSYFAALPCYVKKSVSCTSEEQKAATKDATKLFIKLCCLLEHGINISKANFQLKLLLIKAYNAIGATGMSYNVYEKLDLKHIQMDTLGHVLTFQALDSGRHTIASRIFSSTLKFFMANYKDTSDPLIMSYKFGSLVRIPEFVEFRDRLNNSLHFASVTVEQMLLDLTTEANSFIELEEIVNRIDTNLANEKTDMNNLQDNRDLRVMNNWDPDDRRQNEQIKVDTFKDEVAMLELRKTLLRIVTAAFNLRKNGLANNYISNKDKTALVNGDLNENCDNGAINFKELVTKLRKEIEDCDKYKKSIPPFIPLQGPDTPRIYRYTKGHYLTCFLKHVELFLRVYNCTDGPDGIYSWTGESIKTLQEASELMISHHFPQIIDFQASAAAALPGVNGRPLVQLSHFVQTVSFIVILLGCCNSLLTPIKSSLVKKNKKKKGSVIMPEIIVNFNGYIATLLGKLQKFETALNEKRILVKRDLDSNFKNGYSDIHLDSKDPDFDHKFVCARIEDSFSASLSNLHSAFISKMKFLSNLKV